MPTYTTPTRSTHRFARLRPLIRWDWNAGTVMYTLAIGPLPSGTRLWDTTVGTWVTGEPSGWMNATVWQGRRSSLNWHSHSSAAGGTLARGGTNTQPQVLMRKIEESIVRRFKLVRMLPSDPGYWRYGSDRLTDDSLQCERGFNGRVLPQGTDLIVCRTQAPLADASSWRQWITRDGNTYTAHLIVGDYYYAPAITSSLADAQRLADEQWNTHMRIAPAARAQVTMPTARPRVGAPGFTVEQPAPLPAGWAAGWQ